MLLISNSQRKRFWDKIYKSDKNNCWLWKTNHFDYNSVRISGKLYKSHRVAWILANNTDIPINMEICHKCDNPSCCNPNHLFLGTHKDNMIDARKKGRFKSKIDKRGTNSPNNKLTDYKVKTIFDLYNSNKYTAKMLGKKFTVSQSTINDILYGKTWNHITGLKSTKKKYTRKNSSVKYKGSLTNKEKTGIFPIKTLMRFWFKVNRKTKNECWLWTGTISRGYGNFSYKNHCIRANRFSWQVSNKKPIPVGMLVCHKCNNKLCVNPRHLYLGTNKDNAKDAINNNLRKSRQGSEGLKGQENGNSKLRNNDVKLIIKLYKTKQHTRLELSKLFNVHLSSIQRIVTGNSWKHIIIL